MEYVYLLKRGSISRHYFSSLESLAKAFVEDYEKCVQKHTYPQYFISKWPEPTSFFDRSIGGFYKVFKYPVDNMNEGAQSIGIDVLREAFFAAKKIG